MYEFDSIVCLADLQRNILRHHLASTIDTYQITSTHHQMQYPFDLNEEDYEILYWAQNRCTRYEGDQIDPKKIVVEPEIVAYHEVQI